MRPGTKIFLGTTLGFSVGVALTILFERAYASNGFLRNSLDTALMPPITPTKVLALAAALVTFAALPIAILEWRAERRFLRAERELRAERPGDAITRYEGPEGRGFLFDGPSGRTLLLEGAGGFGAPRRIDLPPVEPHVIAEAEAPLGELS